MMDKNSELTIIVGIAQDEFSNELGTFIPNTLAIKVGIIRMMEISVNNKPTKSPFHAFRIS
jgi:hypothetical protein